MVPYRGCVKVEFRWDCVRKHAASPRVGTVDPSSRSPARHERVPCLANETNKTITTFSFIRGRKPGGASNNDNFASLTPAVNFVEIRFVFIISNSDCANLVINVLSICVFYTTSVSLVWYSRIFRNSPSLVYVA